MQKFVFHRCKKEDRKKKSGEGGVASIAIAECTLFARATGSYNSWHNSMIITGSF